MNYDAALLLDLYRPSVEHALKAVAERFPGRISECPSQSLRAKQAVEMLHDEWRGMGIQSDWELRRKLMRYHDYLSDFLAIHRTVCIFEQKCVTECPVENHDDPRI